MTSTQLQRVIQGITKEVILKLNSTSKIEHFLKQIGPALQRGKQFLLHKGSRYFTLLEKFADIRRWLEEEELEGGFSFTEPLHSSKDPASDAEAKDRTFYANVTVSMAPDRTNRRGYTHAQGSYFPYTHTFDCKYLTEELANLGCFKKVVNTNYDDNCLYNAFKSAGVSEETLNAMKTFFLRRKISRENLHKIADQHDLYIEITTHGDKNLLKYGNPENFKIKLALFKEHYIHLYDTKFNSYAVLHYDAVKNKGKNWWTWKTEGNRDAKRGMNSINLLKTILETSHIKMIDIATEGIFQTQFYDQVSFSSLHYPPKYSKLFHPTRGVVECEDEDESDDAFKTEEEIEETIDGEEENELKKRILFYRQIIEEKDPLTLHRLDAKFRKFQMGLEEQAKLLNKSIPVDANIFFDFEATTEESLDAKTVINRCATKILNMRQGQSIIETIENKVAEGNLDVDTRARLYQEQCPHVGYVCCYRDYKEETVHELYGPSCAKDFLDDICEKYGREKGIDSDEKKFKPPVVKLLAHNITYDLSFLWPYLTRVKTVEKCVSVVCGSAYYYRFGSERTHDSRALSKSRPNADLVNWMKGEGRSALLDFGMEFKSQTRRMHSNAWEKAIKNVRDHPHYLENFSDFLQICGISKAISTICKQAPFDEFKMRPPFCLDKVVELRFQDTYKMINMPLAKWGKSFKLKQEKEVMPYKLYTEEFVNGGGMASLDQLKKVPDFKDYGQLFKNLVDWGCQIDDKFDMIKYSRIYCKADVNVMVEGWKIFRRSFLEFADIDCFSYVTISSLGDAYMTEQGCYIGVHQIAGVPQRFITNASVGGRVMCANNERVALDKNSKDQADFDGRSLYPSAMARIPGFLKGSPKVWHEGVKLNETDGYFLKIRILSVGKKWRFPICRIKENGTNRWTNDLENEIIYVDRFTLEDLVKFSKVKYEILQGYYFNDGRNSRVQEVITNLFNMRRIYQNQKNPLQLVIKLVMNAAYGICGLKPVETDIKYIEDGERYNNFVNLHFNRIKYFTRMNNNEWRFELYKEIDTHYNRQHVACEILSVSKNIMNEVMCLAEDIGAQIHYTDTDSMHIDNNMVERLGEEFQKKYNRKLIGEDLGQFHTDFDFSGSYHTVKGKLEKVEDSLIAVGDIKAIESYFIAKKTYLDKLVDEAGQECYHIRFASVPPRCIQAKCDEDYEGNPSLLYKDLFEGKSVFFDLTKGGNCVFKSNKNHTITTSSMIKEIKFPIEVNLADFKP